jgi:hypothetical protein
MPNAEIKRKHGDGEVEITTSIIFSAVIIALCAFIFLYDYGSVYNKNTSGGFFSPSVGVIFKHGLLALTAILASTILKLILKRRIAISFLIAASILLPIFCYSLNYHSFKKDAAFYPLVSEGGALHFITIHDFDFDGVNDEYGYDGEDVRELSGDVYLSSAEDFVSSVTYTVVGKGGKLDSTWCTCFDGKILIHLYKSRVTYESIKITLKLKNSVDAEDVALYLFGEKLDCEIGDGKVISVAYDSYVCAEWQGASSEELITTPISYILED